jgi:hypothetical protein
MSAETVILACALFDVAGMVILRGAFPLPVISSFASACAERLHTLRQVTQEKGVDDVLYKGDGFSEVRSRTVGRVDYTVPDVQKALLRSSPLFHPLLSALLGTDHKLMRCGCVNATPHPHHQAWHSDGGHVDPPTHASASSSFLASPPYCVNVFLPLIDMTHMHGPTEFAPGTHTRKSSALTLKIAPCLPKSSCIIADFRLGHRGMANRSEEDRPLLYLNYARSWYEDSVNFTPRSLLRSSVADIQAAKAEYASKNAKSRQAEYFLRQQQYMQ